MALFQGRALLYGIAADGITASFGAYAQIYMDSMPIVDKAKFDEHIGVDGLTSAFVWTNPYFEVTANIRPTSVATVAAAEAAVVFVTKGSIVTLANFKIVKYTPLGTSTPVDIINGDWLLMGDTTITLNRNDPATIDVVLRRHPDSPNWTQLKKVIPAGP